MSSRKWTFLEFSSLYFRISVSLKIYTTPWWKILNDFHEFIATIQSLRTSIQNNQADGGRSDFIKINHRYIKGYFKFSLLIIESSPCFEKFILVAVVVNFYTSNPTSLKVDLTTISLVHPLLTHILPCATCVLNKLYHLTASLINHTAIKTKAKSTKIITKSPWTVNSMKDFPKYIIISWQK